MVSRPEWEERPITLMFSRENMPLAQCQCLHPQLHQAVRVMAYDPETEELMLDVWWCLECDRPIRVSTDVEGLLFIKE